MKLMLILLLGGTLVTTPAHAGFFDKVLSFLGGPKLSIITSLFGSKSKKPDTEELQNKLTTLMDENGKIKVEDLVGNTDLISALGGQDPKLAPFMSLLGGGKPNIGSILGILGQKDPKIAAIANIFSGGKPNIGSLLSLIGNKDPKLAQIVSLLTSGGKPDISTLLGMFGDIDPKLAGILQMLGSGGKPDIISLLSMFGNNDPKIAQILAVLNNAGKPDIAALLNIFGVNDPKITQVLAMLKGGKPDISAILSLFGNVDPKIASIVNMLSTGKSLEISDVLSLMGNVDPKITTLLNLIQNKGKLDIAEVLPVMGEDQEKINQILAILNGEIPSIGNISDLATGKSLKEQVLNALIQSSQSVKVQELLNENGKWKDIINADVKQEVLNAVASNSRVKRIFERYGKTNLDDLLGNKSSINITDLLNSRGKSLLRRELRRSSSLRRKLSNMKWDLDDFVSDNIVALGAGVRLPTTITSNGDSKIKAAMAVVGSFRGNFGKVGRSPASETLRIAALNQNVVEDINIINDANGIEIVDNTCTQTLDDEVCEIKIQTIEGESTNGSIKVNFMANGQAQTMVVPLSSHP